MAEYQKPSFQNRDNRPSPPPPQLPIDILEKGIKSNNIDLLKEWGEYLAKDGSDRKKAMTTSQIRKFFGEIKRIQADFENCKQDIVLLDPKIAYAVGRAKKEGATKIEDFYKQVNPFLLKINENKDYFKNFVNVCESIVAYHKAADGK